jgi:hypothetical protein
VSKVKRSPARGQWAVATLRIAQFADPPVDPGR